MMTLMGDDVFPLRRIQYAGQVDFRTEEAHHKGRINIVSNVDSFLEWNRHPHLFPQFPIGYRTAQKHKYDSGKPCKCQVSLCIKASVRLNQWFSGRCVFPVPRIICTILRCFKLDFREHFIHIHHAGKLCSLRDEAHATLNGNGYQKPQQYDSPERI